MKYQVLTIKPGGGRKQVLAELDEKGIVNVDIDSGASANVLSVSLDDFVSMQISITAFNKTENKARLKVFHVLNLGNSIIETSSSNVGNGLSFKTAFNSSSSNMNIVIENNNSYNITVSISQKLLGN